MPLKWEKVSMSGARNLEQVVSVQFSVRRGTGTPDLLVARVTMGNNNVPSAVKIKTRDRPEGGRQLA